MSFFFYMDKNMEKYFTDSNLLYISAPLIGTLLQKGYQLQYNKDSE